MAFDRTTPYPARLVDKRLLTGPGSARPTLHVALSIDDGRGSAVFAYEPGDVVGIFVHNDAALAQQIARQLGLSGDESANVHGADMPIVQALTERLSLGSPPLKLLRAAAERVAEEDEAIALTDLCDDDAELDRYAADHDLLDFLDEHPALRFSAAELPGLLLALQPRTYSIASSPRLHPREIHLTVGLIRWERQGRRRAGVASAHLERMQLGQTIPMYWQPSRHFRLPADDVPLVLIGPGTGVAPFRGFLQDRAATKGAQSWLFFGAQTSAHDFYYREELEHHARDGQLARLELAFSRDQPERVYVQHRMRAAGRELFALLERGAHIYLCGDASKMAPDVERTLAEIIATHGGDGAAYLTRLRDEQRFRRDVY